MSNIQFFAEDISFELENPATVQEWVNQIAQTENTPIDTLSYIFCSDEYLLKVNQDYLNHDYYTDIITFDNSEDQGQISGDIFISVDRVRENAQSFHVPFKKELFRVIAHGLLHLCGYGDKTEDQKITMRQKEDTCISLLQK